MKIKTRELIGAALDWAVAKCDGWQPVYTNGALYPVFQKGGNVEKIWREYSTDWSQAGPIIEREKISLECKQDGWWVASCQYNYSEDKEHVQLADAPLIAAMRCFVDSKLGNEIEIPEELLGISRRC